MKKYRFARLPLAATVGAILLVLTTFAASRKKSAYEYYRVSGPPHSTNKVDYRFDPDGECALNPSVTCSAFFTNSVPPVLCSMPDGMFVSYGKNGEYLGCKVK